MLDYARSLAVAAAGSLRDAHRNLETRRVDFKGRRDLVTDVDRRIESFLADEIAARFPADAILAEESIRRPGRSGRVWLVDPLDGTTNFVHGHPMVCVSIAVAEGYTDPPDPRSAVFDERASGYFAPPALPRLLLGVVAAPLMGEIFWAQRGGGAWSGALEAAPVPGVIPPAAGEGGVAPPEDATAAGARRLGVSPTVALERALLASGFAYRRNELRNTNLANFSTLAMRAQGIRRGGSAALDLCYVAAGRFDGFWELYLKPWDVAAGLLLVEEAGGRVTDFQGGARAIEGVEIVASNGHLHEELRRLLEGPDPAWAAGERARLRTGS